MQARAMIGDPPPRDALAFGKAAQAVISEMTSPAPSEAASRRNGASVMPDIGARKTRFGSFTGPTEMVFISIW